MRFNKLNQTNFPDALIKEARGLASLKNTLQQNHISIRIPQVFSVDKKNLVLEKINPQQGSNLQWQTLGRMLAELHAIPQPKFGWHESNYIGLNPQINPFSENWGQFFIQHRLKHQINLIRDALIKSKFKLSLASIQNQLNTFLNDQTQFPSLIHGDLWSGNVLFDASDVWLIDPAVYCGDAETDLAMSELFGGFPMAFYQAYWTIKPQSPSYDLKKVIYNLYHQLNHYNLFGNSYLTCCEQALKTLENQFS